MHRAIVFVNILRKPKRTNGIGLPYGRVHKNDPGGVIAEQYDRVYKNDSGNKLENWYAFVLWY